MANKIREMLAQAIERNGGYSRGYGERFALEFNVALDHADLSPEHLYTIAKTTEYPDLPPLPASLNWDENDVWQWVQEDMFRDLNDGYAYRTYSPATAKRFGLPYEGKRRYSRIIPGKDCAYYPAKVAGWKLDQPYVNESFSVEMGLYGRGGKHLCISEFEGKSLEMSSDDLAEAIRNDDSGDYPNAWCVRLLAMIEEWSECFTPRKASAEMEYQAAFLLGRAIEERRAAWLAALKEARARRYWASRDVATVGDVNHA